MNKVCFRWLVAMFSAIMLVGMASAQQPGYYTYSFHPMTSPLGGSDTPSHMGFLMPSDEDGAIDCNNDQCTGTQDGAIIYHFANQYYRHLTSGVDHQITYMRWQQSAENWPVSTVGGTRTYCLYRRPYTVNNTGEPMPAQLISTMTLYASDSEDPENGGHPIADDGISTWKKPYQRSKKIENGEFNAMFEGHHSNPWNSVVSDNYGYQSSCVVAGTEYWSGHYNCGWTIIGFNY